MKEEHITKVLTQIIEGNMPYERFCRLTDKLSSRYPDHAITKLAKSMIQKEDEYGSLMQEVSTMYADYAEHSSASESMHENDHFIDLAQYALEKRQALMNAPKKKYYMPSLLRKIACF